MKKHYLLTAITAISTIVFPASKVLAQDAATIEGEASGTTVTYGNASGAYPIITAIVTQPGTYNGKTYNSWAFLAQDSSGSLEVYGLTNSSTFAVGDAISLTGVYSPYHQLPEIEYPYSGVTIQSTGNTVPSTQVDTVSALNVTTLPQTLEGYLIQIDNITISSGSSTLSAGETWGTANLTLTITDGTGSMTMYYYPTSVGEANENLFGKTIPTGPVDITGYDTVYPGTTPEAEFVPIDITSVPEPNTLALCGLGALTALVLRSRKSNKS